MTYYVVRGRAGDEQKSRPLPTEREAVKLAARWTWRGYSHIYVWRVDDDEKLTLVQDGMVGVRHD